MLAGPDDPGYGASVRDRAIQETRRKFDASGRAAWKRHRVRPPDWCDADDPLYEVYPDSRQERLFQHGLVVWAVMVQANQLLFQPGGDPCPAMLLYGLDPAVDDAVPTLREIARELFALKGTRPTVADQVPFAKRITDEMARDLAQPIPASLARKQTLATTTTMIHRQALPLGYMSGVVLPLLVHPPERTSLVLPHEYWSERILFEWGAPIGESSEVV